MYKDFMQIYKTMTITAQKEIYNFALFYFLKMASTSKSHRNLVLVRLKIKYIASDFDAPLSIITRDTIIPKYDIKNEW